MNYTLTPDERVEYDALLADVVSATAATGARADLMIDGLRDAEQAGRSWATRVLDDMLHDGAAKAVKDKVKAGSRKPYKTKGGDIVDVTTVVGIERDGQYLQLELGLLTPAELASKNSEWDRQIQAFGLNRAVGRRLAKICDEHPDSATVDDACARAGTTVEAVLVDWWKTA